MYSLKYIYTRCGKQVAAYLPSELALIDCIAKSIDDKPFQYAVAIFDDVQHKTYTLDAATILQERYDNTVITWQQFMDGLREEYIVGYAIDPFGFFASTNSPKTTFSTFYPFHYVGLEPHYCNIKTPDLRDVWQFRWSMPDLVIENTKEVPINFNNCIPIVNGFCTQPTVFENQLYIRDGAKLLWDTSKEHRADAVLIDTTPLGNMSIAPIRDTTVMYRNRTNNRYTNCDWEFILPDGYNFLTHTVLLVLGGMIYFPDEYVTTSIKSFVIHPCTLALDKQLLMKQVAMNRDDMVVEAPYTVDTYLKQMIWADTCNDAFLIFIDNPHIYVHRTPCDSYADYHVAMTNAFKGVLRNKSTHQIVPYTESKYTSLQLLYMNNTKDMVYFDSEYSSEIPVGTDLYLKKDQYPFSNLREAQFELIQLMTGNR